MEYTWWNGESGAWSIKRTLSFEDGKYYLFYHGTGHTGLDSEIPKGTTLSEKQAAFWLYEKDPSAAEKWFPQYSVEQLRYEWMSGDVTYPPEF
jgi:hypothetical protein